MASHIIDPQSPRIPAFLLQQSNYVRIVDASPAMSSPTSPKGGVPTMMLANSTIPIDRNMTHTSRNSRPLVSGLPKKVYDLSSLMQMSSSPAAASSATEQASQSLTTNSPLSQLLSLLPRKRQRPPSSGEGEEAFEVDEDSSEREEHEVRKSRHRPNLKKVDEVSHLGRYGRQVGISATLFHSPSYSNNLRNTKRNEMKGLRTINWSTNSNFMLRRFCGFSRYIQATLVTYKLKCSTTFRSGIH
jgi:hypothetical protein